MDGLPRISGCATDRSVGHLEDHRGSPHGGLNELEKPKRHKLGLVLRLPCLCGGKGRV